MKYKTIVLHKVKLSPVPLQEDYVNRSRLIAGSAILAVLIILLGYGLLQRQTGETQASQRAPLSKLGYCDSNDIRPCIVSFSLDSDRNMFVNVLVPVPSFPEFYIKIAHDMGESIYECEDIEGFPANVYCIGEEMRPGEILQFMLFSKNRDTLLAEGNFAIVGLALSTPEIIGPLSPTVELTVSPTVTVSPSPKRTPTPIRATPSPSYPNPPYPNPSYP